MLDTFFQGIFGTATIHTGQFLLCLGCALILGAVLALAYCYRNRCTGSFVFTLALLPAVVCVVILLVNGNIGTGVAVAGAFSLVRFRSVPGTAKEIGILFLAMGAGLITGMGYLGYACLFTLIMALFTVIYHHFSQRMVKNRQCYKTLTVTIPEDLQYGDVFAPILQQYASRQELVRVKTTNLGSLFRLTYHLTMKPDANEKDMIDALRCHNGNLEISLSPQDTGAAEL